MEEIGNQVQPPQTIDQLDQFSNLLNSHIALFLQSVDEIYSETQEQPMLQ